MVEFYIYGQSTRFDIANTQITYQGKLAHVLGGFILNNLVLSYTRHYLLETGDSPAQFNLDRFIYK